MYVYMGVYAYLCMGGGDLGGGGALCGCKEEREGGMEGGVAVKK